MRQVVIVIRIEKIILSKHQDIIYCYLGQMLAVVLYFLF